MYGLSDVIIAPPLGGVSTKAVATGIPGIGTIDFSNPIEIGIWGAIAAALAIPKDTTTKVVIAGGLLVFRSQLAKVTL